MTQRAQDAAPLEVTGHLQELATRPASLAPLWRALHGALTRLPEFKPDAQGQRRARSMRAALFGLGLLFLLASERHPLKLTLALSLMGAAAALPLPAARKRAWLKALTQRQHQTVAHKRAARLVHDGRRLELHLPEQPMRRVLTHQRFELDELEARGWRWMRIGPSRSGAKGKSPEREAIWMRWPDSPGADSSADEALVHEPLIREVPALAKARDVVVLPQDEASRRLIARLRERAASPPA